MRFDGSVDIAASRARVWAFLTDPRQVSTCVPDFQSLEVIDPTHVNAVVRASIGPIKGAFALTAELSELRAPEHARVTARGRAPGIAVELRSTVDLSAASETTTTMRWTADVSVSGMMAGLASRVPHGTAEKTPQRVVDCIRTKLETQSSLGNERGPPFARAGPAIDRCA